MLHQRKNLYKYLAKALTERQKKERQNKVMFSY